MATTSDRSQPLFKIPRDQTPVTILLEDGQRSSAFLFVPPGESVIRALANASAFVPVSFAEGTRLVARGSIACITVHVIHARLEDDDGLPQERQKTRVRLRGGHIVNGELRWVASLTGRRALDHLNDESTHLLVHTHDEVSYLSKAHVMSVEEL